MALLLLDDLYRESPGVRVYRGSLDGITGKYSTFDKQFFELAQALSRSPHFNIIDSYTDKWWSNKPWDGELLDPGPPPVYEPAKVVTSKRHKGDPITDLVTRDSGQTYPVWDIYEDDVGLTNCWFVVECQTENQALAAMGFSGLPKWQIKFQWEGNWAGQFQDVSDTTGIKYPNYHNTDRIACQRLGPWGGWDLADVNPDFDPATPPLPAGVVPSSQNAHFYYGSGDSDNRTQFVITADGFLAAISTTSFGGKAFNYIGSLVGDVVPRTVTSMPMPRAMFEPTTYGGFALADFLQSPAQYYQGRHFHFWDYNYELVTQTQYTTARRSGLRWANQNEYDNLLLSNSHPIIVLPSDRMGMSFELSHMREAWRVAVQTTGDKQWLHPAIGWSAIFPWDGITDPYEGY